MLTPEDRRIGDVWALLPGSFLGSKEIRFECLSTDAVLPSPKCCKERVAVCAL